MLFKNKPKFNSNLLLQAVFSFGIEGRFHITYHNKMMFIQLFKGAKYTIKRIETTLKLCGFSIRVMTYKSLFIDIFQNGY